MEPFGGWLQRVDGFNTIVIRLHEVWVDLRGVLNFECLKYTSERKHTIHWFQTGMKEIKRIKKEELEEIKKFFKRKKNLKIRIKKLKNEILKNFKKTIFFIYLEKKIN